MLQGWPGYGLLWCYILWMSPGVQSLVVVPPSLQPLQYINFESLGAYAMSQLGGIQDKGAQIVLGALLPVNQEDALAIFVSEGVSGSLGGLAGKVVALIDGNKNNRKDSLAVNAGTYGAYFGVAGAVRSLASIGGFSDLAVSLSAFALATIVSELIKFRSTSIMNQRTRVNDGPSMYELMKFNQPTMRDLMVFQSAQEKAGLDGVVGAGAGAGARSVASLAVVADQLAQAEAGVRSKDVLMSGKATRIEVRTNGSVMTSHRFLHNSCWCVACVVSFFDKAAERHICPYQYADVDAQSVTEM